MPTGHHSKPNYPFAAPCSLLPFSAPIRWLKRGVNDVCRAPFVSLILGLLMTIMVMTVILAAWQYKNVWLMVLLLCGFVFAAPIACIGTYAVSAQLERNQSVSLKRIVRACFKRYLGSILVFTLILLVVFLLWARASSMVSVFIPLNPEAELGQMLSYLLSLGGISLLFLSFLFSASIFSLPMIMHRDVDAITATVTSINAVLRNKVVMIFWSILILLSLLVGVLSAGIGLIFLLPVIGYAVWHGYLETIDTREFPRHKLGITAMQRDPS